MRHLPEFLIVIRRSLTPRTLVTVPRMIIALDSRSGEQHPMCGFETIVDPAVQMLQTHARHGARQAVGAWERDMGKTHDPSGLWTVHIVFGTSDADVDNITTPLLNGIKGIVFTDDRQVRQPLVEPEGSWQRGYRREAGVQPTIIRCYRLPDWEAIESHHAVPDPYPGYLARFSRLHELAFRRERPTSHGPDDGP